MASGESSASEGEIFETTNKANTASSHIHEPGVDNFSSGFGLDGASDRDGYSNRKRAPLQAPYRRPPRSPSPYRRKQDRSPSPYRRGRSRSPSPYRHDRASRGRPDRNPQTQKRKASPHRHSRPEKRYYSERTGGHGQRDVGQHDHSHRGRQHGGHRDHDDVRDQHYDSTRSFRKEKSTRNGNHTDGDSQARRLNTSGLVDSVDLAHRNRDPHVDSTTAAQDEPEYTLLPTTKDTAISQESREERKRRWAAKRAQLASESTNLLQHAVLTRATEATTPSAVSPVVPLEDSVSPSTGSPRFPDVDSVPPSPDVMVVDKEEGVGEGVSPPAEGPSAAHYDPTQDMLDDRVRAEQKFQESGMSAAEYDETSSKQLSTLPAEKVQPAKKKKKEIDMFASSDEDDADQDADEEEENGQSKGTVLDVKLMDNWDDADGYYKIISNELVNGRYRMVKGLGRGVFANVAQAEDVKDDHGQLVAIKIVRRNDAMKKASQKEMDFLRRLNESDPQDKKHIIRLLGTFDHKGHLCIVFEHMSKNLRDLLKEETSGHGLSLQAVKTYSRQMLSGLKHLQDCQIVHADLKPDNILVSLDKKTVKICDLGTAADKRDNNDPTPYLVSRFYRAPEIILGMEIGYAIDMWAIGCTIYELWTGKILFPGRSNNQMIRVIMECLGWPSEKLLKKGHLSGQHYEPGPPLIFVSREVDTFGNQFSRKIEQQRMASRALKTRVQEAGRGITGNGPSAAELNDFTDLLGACLNWNFEKRIQPKEAINHKFFVKPALAPRSAVVKPTIPKRGFNSQNKR